MSDTDVTITPNTMLFVRRDWGFVKFAYLPMLIVALIILLLLPKAGVLKFGCSISCCVRKDRKYVWGFSLCDPLEKWSNHAEEWYHRKPILQATFQGLVHEDGRTPIVYQWAAIKGVVFHRHVPPWRTGGQSGINLSHWLEILLGGKDGNDRIVLWSLRRFAKTIAQHMNLVSGQARIEGN